MRELMISNLKFPIFDGQQIRQPRYYSIEKLIKISSECCSIELCPNRYLDTELLSKIQNRFVSVTWHTPLDSDFSNVEEIPTISFVKRLHFHGYNILLHLPGRHFTEYQVVKILDKVRSFGVANIFALQGDQSQVIEQNDSKYDFPYAADLVKFIRTHYGTFFSIGVAGYPEKHPKFRTVEDDIKYLKRKVDAGANFIITQASYSYEAFQNFAQLCRSTGINVPIIPGIFIISSLKTLTAMSNFCGVFIPKDILDIVKENEHNEHAVENFGVFHATQMIKKILRNGNFCGFHVFSLNDFLLLKRVLRNLGFQGSRIERPFSYH